MAASGFTGYFFSNALRSKDLLGHGTLEHWHEILPRSSRGVDSDGFSAAPLRFRTERDQVFVLTIGRAVKINFV